MADGDQKTFTLDEHLAILADRVTKETANLSTERDQLTTKVTELENKLDVETSARQAAELRAEEAEKSLEDFKTEVQEREAAAARKGERIKKVREAAQHLDEKFFEDEKRVERIVAMSEEAFDGYVDDLATSASVAPKGGTTVPRETAMKGAPAQVVAPEASVARGFLMRRFVVPATEGGK